MKRRILGFFAAIGLILGAMVGFAPASSAESPNAVKQGVCRDPFNLGDDLKYYVTWRVNYFKTDLEGGQVRVPGGNAISKGFSLRNSSGWGFTVKGISYSNLDGNLAVSTPNIGSPARAWELRPTDVVGNTHPDAYRGYIIQGDGMPSIGRMGDIYSTNGLEGSAAERFEAPAYTAGLSPNFYRWYSPIAQKPWARVVFRNAYGTERQCLIYLT